MKLSVIIPVYNVAPYITKCLESVYFQDVDKGDYEIIIVNDGSTDNSLSIVKKTIVNWENVKLIDQSNGGLSCARNSGLDCAIGDYVWFVDSDDWIESNSLKRIFCQLNDLDIMMLEFSNVIHSVKYPNSYRVEHSGVLYKGTDILKQRNPQCAVQFYILNRAFLNLHHLKFKVGIYHEDSLFTPMALYYAKKIVFDHIPVYCYLHREGSIMHSYNAIKHCNSLIEVIKELNRFVNSEVEDNAKVLLYNRIASATGGFIKYWISLNRKEKLQVLSDLRNIHCLNEYVRKSGRQKIYVALLLLKLYR